MLIYWIILCWVLLVGGLGRLYPRTALNDNKLYEKRCNIFFAILTFSIIIFFVGLRSGVLDTSAYINGFMNTTTGISALNQDYEGKDIGFYYLNVIFKTFISSDFHAFLFMIALVCGIATMLPLYKYSPMFELSSFLFVSTANFTWMLNGIRQFIPASILFCCIPLIVNKNRYLFICIVILLSTIHFSAIIMIPVYFLVQRKFTKNIIPLILFFGLFSLFSGKLIPMLEPLLENTQYAGYTDYVFEYSGSSIFRVLVASVPILIAVIKWEEIKNMDSKILNICLNMSVINIGIMIVSSAVGGILIGRLSIYFELYNLILYPMLFIQFTNKKERRLIYYLCIVFYTLYFYYQIVVVWKLPYVSDILNLYIYN